MPDRIKYSATFPLQQTLLPVLAVLAALASSGMALASGPQPTDAMSRQNQLVYMRAHKLYGLGNTQGARQVLEPFCFKKETSASMYCLLAETYIDDYNQRQSDLQKVEPILQLAIKADPTMSIAYKDMAEYYNLMGDFNKAVSYATKSKQCAKPYLMVWRQSAIAYSNLGQYDKALADIDYIISKGKPSEPIVIMKAGILEKMKRWEDAANAYRLAYSISPKDLNMYSVVRCLESAHKFTYAISEISRVIKINPHDADALAVRAKLQKENKNYAFALDDFSRAIDLDPSARLYKGRAEIYQLLGQKQAAERDLASAKKADSNPF